MLFYSKSKEFLLQEFKSDEKRGLNEKNLKISRQKYGENKLTAEKKKPLFIKITDALLEPMILILSFGFLITLGVNIGKLLKTGQGDFSECIGILFAISLSVFITLFMEGSSEKAFSALNKLYKKSKVKVVRNGETVFIGEEEVLVGDIVFLSSGEKVVADGRLIYSNELKVDESALTGESLPIKKSAEEIESESTPLAERKNSVYSGTFITSGEGKMLVCNVGNNTEIGSIAKELSKKKEGVSPLSLKLNKLTKTVTILGAVFSFLTFVITVIRLIQGGNLTFEGITDAFISAIVLVVAAVPEGLPAIVAVSLAINMSKLAKENALIKKLTATETAGAISVICSDKTGTLTENKMKVERICTGDLCKLKREDLSGHLIENISLNSTAELSDGDSLLGSATEGALLLFIENKSSGGYKKLRDDSEILYRLPFSSEKKYMVTSVKRKGKTTCYIKGAIEKTVNFSTLTPMQKAAVLSSSKEYAKTGKRIIAFYHKEDFISGELEGFTFDGFAVISDAIRKEVYEAVKLCKRAHIDIKVLTGDNEETAVGVAKELKIFSEGDLSMTGEELEKLSGEDFDKAVKRVKVVARSTPSLKLRIVKSLKKSGEVVAVTGDGVNDAPAIKHADIGIAMGKTGSEISKEAADVILLDDSFATIVKAVSFGRNVYKNIQRFITFQLTVNLSAFVFVIVSLIFYNEVPFNTLQLLWINVIMDGPPAITLGLEKAGKSLMNNTPVKKNDSLVSIKQGIRILLHAGFISAVMILQAKFNFIAAEKSEMPAVLFTLFITFQLFNAFNAKELGENSAFSSLKNNKLMPVTFIAAFLLHVFIIEVGYSLINVEPISFITLLKTVLTASTILFFSETYKFFYRSKALKKIKVKKFPVNKNVY